MAPKLTPAAVVNQLGGVHTGKPTNSTTYNRTSFVNVSGDTMTGGLIVSGDTTVGGNTVLSGDTWIKGDLRVDGNAYLSAGTSGRINVGDTNTDNIIFHAE